MTAILLVYGLVWIVGWQMRETSSAVAWSGRIGAFLVVLVGFLLAFQATRGLVQQVRHREDHSHNRDHHHDHGDGCGCGHAHVPTASQMAEAGNWRTTVGLVLSIGLRPCSGTVLILAFAQAVHLAGMGIAAVLAMSAGTALSVAGLALLAVKARDWSAAIVGRKRRRLRLVGGAISLFGGPLIMGFGVALAMATFSQGHPLGLF